MKGFFKKLQVIISPREGMSKRLLSTVEPFRPLQIGWSVLGEEESKILKCRGPVSAKQRGTVCVSRCKRWLTERRSGNKILVSFWVNNVIIYAWFAIFQKNPVNYFAHSTRFLTFKILPASLTFSCAVILQMGRWTCGCFFCNKSINALYVDKLTIPKPNVR